MDEFSSESDLRHLNDYGTRNWLQFSYESYIFRVFSQTSKIRSQLHYYTVNYMSITARIELPNCFLVLDKEYFGISSNSNSTKRLYSVPTFFASI